MAEPYMKVFDNYEFEARFSNDDRIRYDQIRDPQVSFDELKTLLEKLPPREADLIELYYRHGKNQKDIARMFNVTQGAISSRLSRARKRLEFLRDMPKINSEDIEEMLAPYFTPLEIEVIQGMIQTTCQSRTAEIINQRHSLSNDVKRRMTQVKVRHRFEKAISRLAGLSEEHPELKECLKLLRMVKKNLYKLHEVKLPHFNKGECAVFSLRMS
jgi:hypothetical protein